MPIENKFEQKRFPAWAGGTHLVTTLSLSRGWQHSPRSNGTLILQSLPYHKKVDKCLTFSDPTSLMIPTGFSGYLGTGMSQASLDAETQSYQRLRGKLYQGSAALGVTAASYKQSREMVVKRYQTITSSIESIYAQAMRTKRAGRDTAGVVLEGIFGWQPLVADIVSACTTVIQKAPPPVYVSGFGRGFAQDQEVSKNEWLGTTTVIGQGTVTHKRTSQVVVSNPNLWLAERAGTLNVAAVAWDLVPHSYIVNMFTNVGQLVNSITDFAGLSFSGGTITTTTHYKKIHVKTSRDWGTAQSVFSRDLKSRSVGNSMEPPPWSLQFRIPEMNWSLAAIAASVATQKFSRLLSAFPINRRQYTE